MSKAKDKELTADEILAIEDRPEFDVHVPQWGITCRVREPDAETFAVISRAARDADGKFDRVDFLCRCIIVGCIKPKFGMEHLRKLKDKSPNAINILGESIAEGKRAPGASKA
jgi:hypothetical protein